MSVAFANALSGLKANATAINIVSNNLANLNTTGYKNQQVSFQDLVNESLSGFSGATSVSGSTTAKGIQEFTQGTLQTTNNAFDAAIQGGGFFVLRGITGQQILTREGDFKVDANGHMVTSSGQSLQGWNAQNSVLTTTGPTTDITVPTGLSLAPKATSVISLNVNLNSNVAPGSSGGTFSSPIQIFDAQGNPHTLTIKYTETAANAWSVDISIPSADLNGGVGTTTSLGTANLTFDGAGKLLTPAAAGGTVPVAIAGLASGAADMNIQWKLYSPAGDPTLTQNTAVSANLYTSQDGYRSGTLNSFGIGAGGVVVAKFSNGASQNVAQIALASVTNPGSMQQLGGNAWVATNATATPVIGIPSTGARGQINGGTLESSTVDIATEFTNLLQYERGYQANSKVITTQDEIVRGTIALITGN